MSLGHLIVGAVRLVATGIRIAARASQRNESRNSAPRNYRGQRLNGKPHGQGTLKYSNGTVHIGSFANGKREGPGRTIYSNGSIYEGNYHNDQYNGLGKLSYSDGSTYDGSFLNNLREGFGTLTYSNGARYIGNWKNNEQWDENGAFAFTNGTFFIGNFVQGQRHGVGYSTYPGIVNTTNFYHETWEKGKKINYYLVKDIQTIPNHIYIKFNQFMNNNANSNNNNVNSNNTSNNNINSNPVVNSANVTISDYPTISVKEASLTHATYTGTVLKSSPTVPHGHGTWIAKPNPPAFTYVGGFEKGRFQGEGMTHIHSNNGIRRGTYYQGKLNGPGSYEIPGVSKYEGGFLDSKYNGLGQLTYFKSGIVLKGQFLNGQIHGFGTMTWTKDPFCEYKGTFVNGEREGNGIMKWPISDMKYSGQWKAGKRTGRGTMFYQKETSTLLVYQGEFVDGAFKGAGKFITRSGWIYSGSLDNYRPHGTGRYIRISDGYYYEGSFENGKLLMKLDENTLSKTELEDYLQVDIEEEDEEIDNDKVNTSNPTGKDEITGASPVDKLVTVIGSTSISVAPGSTGSTAETSSKKEEDPIKPTTILGESNSNDKNEEGSNVNVSVEIDENDVKAPVSKKEKVEDCSTNDVIEWIKKKWNENKSKNKNDSKSPSSSDSSKLISEGLELIDLTKKIEENVIDGVVVSTLKTVEDLENVGISASASTLGHILDLLNDFKHAF